jgi:hypothetical protein
MLALPCCDACSSSSPRYPRSPWRGRACSSFIPSRAARTAPLAGPRPSAWRAWSRSVRRPSTGAASPVNAATSSRRSSSARPRMMHRARRHALGRPRATRASHASRRASRHGAGRSAASGRARARRAVARRSTVSPRARAPQATPRTTWSAPRPSTRARSAARRRAGRGPAWPARACPSCASPRAPGASARATSTRRPATSRDAAVRTSSAVAPTGRAAAGRPRASQASRSPSPSADARRCSATWRTPRSPRAACASDASAPPPARYWPLGGTKPSACVTSVPFPASSVR